jgi:hypothetical protein
MPKYAYFCWLPAIWYLYLRVSSETMRDLQLLVAYQIVFFFCGGTEFTVLNTKVDPLCCLLWRGNSLPAQLLPLFFCPVVITTLM